MKVIVKENGVCPIQISFGDSTPISFTKKGALELAFKLTKAVHFVENETAGTVK